MTEAKKNLHTTTEMGRIGCPKISVTNYQYTPHDILVERRALGNFQIKNLQNILNITNHSVSYFKT
jgi:hypothetical protein